MKERGARQRCVATSASCALARVLRTTSKPTAINTSIKPAATTSRNERIEDKVRGSKE